MKAEKDKATVEVIEGRRYLLKINNNSYRTSGVEEYKVLEFSPSHNWIKVMNTNGNKFWKLCTDVSFIEELKQIKKAPEQND